MLRQLLKVQNILSLASRSSSPKTAHAEWSWLGHRERGCAVWVRSPTPGCVVGPFHELRLSPILGSSLSSGAARRRLRVCHEAPENGIGDAPLEAAQSLLAGFTLRHLLAVVPSARSIRPGLAGGDHVQSVVELAVAGQRESLWRTNSPLETSPG